MVGWNKIGHYRELSNHRELLNHAMEVSNPHTNSPQLHMVHKTPLEWPTQYYVYICYTNINLSYAHVWGTFIECIAFVLVVGSLDFME